MVQIVFISKSQLFDLSTDCSVSKVPLTVTHIRKEEETEAILDMDF